MSFTVQSVQIPVIVGKNLTNYPKLGLLTQLLYFTQIEALPNIVFRELKQKNAI